MCGIVAAWDGDIVSTISRGLQKLSYRGYDSYGYALFMGRDSKYVNRELGELTSDIHLPNDSAEFKKSIQLGIGHTRWATHGEVSIVNTQPLEYEGIVLVHNGVFNSVIDGSDTRALLHQIYSVMSSQKSKKLEVEAIRKYVARLNEAEGNDNSVVFRNRKYPKVLFAFCTGSATLWYDDTHISSENDDQNSMTKMQPGILYMFWKKSRSIFHHTRMLPRICRPQTQHDMWKEIAQQAHIFKDYELENPVDEFGVDVFPLVSDLGMYEDTPRVSPKTISNVHIVGCGSSYLAGKMACSLFRNKQYSPRAFMASEYAFTDRNSGVDSPSILIGVSQSGETADLRKMPGGLNFLVTNNPSSSLAGPVSPHCAYAGLSSTVIIPLNAGDERAVAATKTFTASCIRLAQMLDFGVPLRLDKFSECVRTIMRDVTLNDDKIKFLIDKLHNVQGCLILGSGMDYPIASEAALKLKEVCYIHSEAMPSSELKHGPIALIERGTPCIFLLTNQSDVLVQRTLNNMHEVESRGGVPFCIAAEKTVTAYGIDSHFNYISVPNLVPGIACSTENYLQALLNVIVMQIVAYNLAKAKGINPNRPRNLAKCVTV